MSPATRLRTKSRAQQFRALSDESRLQVLQLLQGGEHCVCELTEALEIGQSLLSFHLKTLKEAGLVTDRREGRWMYYALATEALQDLAAELGELTTTPAKTTRRGDRCTDRGDG